MGRKRPPVRVTRSSSNKKRQEDSYVDEDPDPEDDSYFMDEVDQFHANKEKILLEDNDDSMSDEFSDEEEVLGVKAASETDSEESEEEELGSDEDDELADGAWGTKRNNFYGGDTLEGLEGSDREEAEKEEEREAKMIQARLASQIDEDFEMENLQTLPVSKDVEVIDSKIISDYSKLSLKEQKKLLRKQSPELKELFKDFAEKSDDLRTEIIPLLELVKNGGIPKGPAADFIDMKCRLYSAYLINITFYLSMKAKKADVRNHPVVDRMVQFRTLINNLAPLNERFQSEVTEYLNSQELEDDKVDGSDVDEELKQDEISNKDEESSEEDKESEENETEKNKVEEMEVKAYYDSIKDRIESKENNNNTENNDVEEAENDDDERRAIDYEMQKNKGLTAKRRKIDRNPRVKHRMKYKKALVRRKGQVRDYKPEINKYSGEHSGIRSGVIKSRKLQ